MSEGTSPYREGGGGPPCPRCLAPMLTAPEGLTCVGNGCGEWWVKESIASTLDWRIVEAAEPYRVFGALAKELPCPECASRMTVSMRAKIEFAHCDAHGLWLNRSERPVFDELGGWSRVLALKARRSQ